VDACWCGAFPGVFQGANEVIRVENVTIENGVARVRVRLTAQGTWFARGFFGNVKRRLDVTVNGCTNSGCAKFRCEEIRPGGRFTWTPACGPIPPCEVDGTAVAAWTETTCGPDCKARFFVIDTTSWDNWMRCEPPGPCVDQSTECDGGYNRVVLEIDFTEKKSSGNQHTFEMSIFNGRHQADRVSFRFSGNEWHGTKIGQNGIITVTDIYPVSGQHWRAKVVLQACDRADGNPGRLPEWPKFKFAIDKDRGELWLDLSCCPDPLKLGAFRTSDGSPVYDVLQWISVVDAGRCPPVGCPCD
jgi:hypothetical protein